jgi:hypothetical protein
MKLNVRDSGSVDLATPGVKFKRMSIPQWNGKIYFAGDQNKKLILGNITCKCSIISSSLLKNINSSTDKRIKFR